MNLLWNLVLTFMWMALWNSFTWTYFVMGFLLSFWFLVIVSRFGTRKRSRNYLNQCLGALGLGTFFFKELWKSNLILARDVLRRRPRIQPAIVAVPLDMNSDLGLTILANLITLTPGTLSLDVSLDRKTLFVHTLYYSDAQQKTFVRDIKEGFERKLKRMGFE